MVKLAARVLVSFLFYTASTVSASEMNSHDSSSDSLDEKMLSRVGRIDFPTVALDKMKLESLSETDWKDDDFVLGIALNAEARAYPLAMMAWLQSLVFPKIWP